MRNNKSLIFVVFLLIDHGNPIANIPPVIFGYRNEDVIIPCKPTSRYASVQLYEEGHEVDSFKKKKHNV